MFQLSSQTLGFSLHYGKTLYVVRCTIWYRLYNLKSVKNTHRGVLLFSKNFNNFTKSNTSSWVFSRFLNCTIGTK